VSHRRSSGRSTLCDIFSVAYLVFITYRVCATLGDMTHATPSDKRDTSRVANFALLGFTFIVAAVTFVLSFHGLDDYGHRVAQLGKLSPLVPVAVDGLTLVAVAATTILRNAEARVRAYAWFVFTIAVALSIGGNLSHADSRHMSASGKVGALASPILLALASHLAIVTRRAIERADKRHAMALAERQAVAAESVTPPPAVATPRAPRPATPAATEPASPDAPAVTQRRATPKTPRSTRSTEKKDAAARRMWAAGERSHPKIAMALGISKKTAERYTEPLRQTGATGAPADADSERELAGATA
jgi:uncharacterized protein DUF2637